jgi:hypothetical protein
VFTFGEIGMRNFCGLGERDASKGVADYRMLVRKLSARSPGTRFALHPLTPPPIGNDATRTAAETGSAC